MNVSIATPLLVSFLLATVRAAAWLFVAPPFSSRAVPTPVKAVIAFALALPVAPRLKVDVTGFDTAALVSAVVLQTFIGMALGFVTYLLFAAIQAAGDLIDLFGGFQLASGYDPLSMTQNSVFGRLTSQISTMLLFAFNGHLLMVRGFESSYDAVPLGTGLDLDRIMHVLTTCLGQFVLAALQIAAPMIGVLFVVDVGLGLLTRIAPALNAFQLGFPAKILATLLIFGACVPLLPSAVQRITDLCLHAMAATMGMGG
ncbi:flagellar biosynthetic protein FliR [Motilibacter peucedani]|uniref:Flagellar biosynthetic protein FliR n=1 Tax=Motilibacter peucedani TaxID=598650 RepID=A0A420XTN1_9ACTN|nr:flagellar biosynthetic protein FliR [Motilibacter peucedani]RKS80117.1 flagellar biosynthetic protein FliR [Motilibacter peucedani]